MSIRSNSIITNNVNNETEKRQQALDVKMQHKNAYDYRDVLLR